jgi:serine/threonine-protein kinase
MPDKIAQYEIQGQQVGEEVITYKAWDPTIGRMVTIKEPLLPLLQDRAFVDSFLEEGKRLATIQDDHVVTLYQILAPGEVDDKCYLVVEHLSESLDDRLARGPVDAATGRTILRDALSGLRAIHQAGLIHANIRPSSILLTPDGRAKIADLRTAWGGRRRGTLTLSAIKYLPPELLEKDGRVGAWSDLYSLGCVAYEMFVGSARFREALAAHDGADEHEGAVAGYRAWHCDLSARATPLSELDRQMERAVSDVVARLMEKAIADRYQEAGQALRDLGDTKSVGKTVVVPQEERDPIKENRTRVVTPTGQGTGLREVSSDQSWWSEPLILVGAGVLGLVLLVLILVLS